MDTILYNKLDTENAARWKSFLSSCALRAGEPCDSTVFIEDDCGEIVATGSRQGNILKYIAVSEKMRGQGLTAVLLTRLRKDAFDCGISRLFLYTKPQNLEMFCDFGFYPVAETGSVLLLESEKDGIGKLLRSQSVSGEGSVGAVVANCNPFTLGHRYLIETAANRCDRLLVFVLSQESGPFPAEDRLELVRQGCEDIKNVTVLRTGDYLISSATFPDYFLKKESSSTLAQCELDVEVFVRHFVPFYGIGSRFVGQEPFSQVTNDYNRVLERLLPERGVAFVEIPRKESASGRAISATDVRALLKRGKPEELKALVPESTLEYLLRHGLV